jgi:hypothetical protein
MGLDFLGKHGGCRMREYDPQPLLLDDGATQSEPEEAVRWDYEIPADDWEPLDEQTTTETGAWPFRPSRFIDGKDEGRTVTTIFTRDRYPIPVRVSEIGAIAVRDINGELRREPNVIVERIVTFIFDPFPWNEVESFAIALRANGFRLISSPAPETGLSYDFERMRKTTQNSSNTEMGRLERRVLAHQRNVPTVVDGRLEPRAGAFDPLIDPVVGLVKSHSRNYLHTTGWQTFYRLDPGQRTPAFLIQGRNLSVVSWYLRIEGAGGEMPNYGIVRLEIAQDFFEATVRKDWNHINRLSHLIRQHRCRDESYARAPISIEPIKRAEDSLRAIMGDGEKLANRFFYLTNL